MASKGDSGIISFFWKYSDNRKLLESKNVLSDMCIGDHNAASSMLKNILSNKISDIISSLQSKKTWVVAYKVDIYKGTVAWNGAAWNPCIANQKMTKSDKILLKRYAVQRLENNPRFMIVPAIIANNDQLYDVDKYTYNWVYTCKVASSPWCHGPPLKSGKHPNGQNNHIYQFQWFRTLEYHIKKQVYNVGFLSNQSRSIVVQSDCPINSDRYNADPITHISSFKNLFKKPSSTKTPQMPVPLMDGEWQADCRQCTKRYSDELDCDI